LNAPYLLLSDASKGLRSVQLKVTAIVFSRNSNIAWLHNMFLR